MMNDPVNPNHIGDASVASTRMTTQSSPPSLAPKTAQRTSLGHRLQRALTGGPNRRFPGFHSPPGGAASLSPFLNRRLGFPILAILALLAVSFLFLLPGGLAHGQQGGASGSGAGCEENAAKTGYDCEYAENDTDPVATFTATDPEGAAVWWDLDGADSGLFSISKDGVLSFKSPPNYELAADADTDNEYVVTVRATDNAYSIDNVAGMVTTKLVTVTVTNKEEPGKVKLTVNGTDGQPVLQPQMGEALTATLSDGDTPTATTITWQWYRGSTEIIGATMGAGTTTSTYTPGQADIGINLTAKATYKDEKNSNDKDMAEATTIMAVRAAPEDNNDPAFPDQTPDDPGNEVTAQDRKVAENTPAGRNIGVPVKANDEGDVLAYSLGGTDVSRFTIDIATGQLKTKGKLNREDITEAEKTYEVIVTAVDPFGQTDMATVTIEIENEDESPAINERNAKAMLKYAEPLLAEDATELPEPVLLWTYEATDHEDDASDTVLKWELEGADKSKLALTVNGDGDGELKFLKNPDFEKPADANKNNVYEVTVVVTDSGDLTDTLAVRVEVTNAKEAGEVTFTVGTPRVGVPLTAELEDPDGDETGHEWQWMVADSSADAGTAIDGATSATFTPRDRDLTKFLSVKVKYTDGKGKDEVTQVLTTAVAASAAPRFYDKAIAAEDEKVVTKFELKLAENTGTFDPISDKQDGDIFVGHRTDDVATVVKYAVGGTDGGSFKIVTGVQGSGEVKLQAQGPLDIEEKGSYAVEVTATDSDGSSATLSVTVTVTPVDEMPVVSGSGAGCEENAAKTGYDCEYAENDTDPVATFTATDPEGAAVWWDLDGADSGLFSISKDGVLSFKSPPNYELAADADTDNEYVVTVRATDNAYSIDNVAGMVTTKLVTVTVTNKEEPGKVKLTVNGTDGQPVLQPQMREALTATLSDGDTPTATTITWQWYRGSTEIIGATMGAGTTTSTYTPGESDIRSRLTAKATYIDEEDANNKKMAEESTLRTVRAAPEDNKDPAFPDQTPDDPGNEVTAQDRKVAENTPAGRNIGVPVKANDEGDVLAYSLGGTDVSRFTIDIATGQLKTKGKLNREDITEAEKTYEVIVTAVDPFGQTDMATVTIEIENEDESPAINERNAKAMLKYAEPLLAEDATELPEPVLLWTYEATDHEDDASDTVLKWELEGADKSKLALTVNGDGDGELKFLKNPDFEKPADANKNNVYEVTVVVTDSGDLTDTLAVRVEVTNAKEAGEVTFTAGTPRVGVPLTAELEDPDGDETGHEWQWMVADSSADAGTAIDGATSATFTPRDRDLTKFLSVKVKYTDGKGKDEVTQVLTTAVAASAAPRFYDKAIAAEDEKVVTKFELKLAENTGTFDPISDKQDGDIFVGHRTDDVATVVKYAVGGTDGGSFKIVTGVQGSGEVKLQAQGPLDIEEKGSYAVEVTATDSDGSSATLSVTVTVTPVDEMPVVMLGGLAISGMSSVHYAENGTDAVATYTAAGPDAASTEWSLEGPDRGDFTVERSGMSVMLKFRSSPNYESAADADTDSVYMVTIKADDGTYMDTHDVTITVTDENEAPVAPTVANQAATKDTAFSYTVPAFTDPEGRTITYTATLSDDSALPEWLSFNASTRELSGTPLEADTPASLTIKVTATDEAGLSDSIDVTITVTDVDEAGTGDPLVDGYDADGSGTIDRAEVGQAVRDFISRQIEEDDVLKVIAQYFTDLRSGS